MLGHNPFSEEEFIDIDPLDLEIIEYEDIARLRRAQQLVSQTEPKLTPTAIIETLKKEGLGVGPKKYKEWERAGLLEDIQQKARALVKKLYEQDCLSVQEIGEIVRSRGYPYHNQLIGVWISQEGWQCQAATPAEPENLELELSEPVLDLQAFTLLVSRLTGEPVSTHSWLDISKIPLVKELPNSTAFNLLFNFLGEETILAMHAQETQQIRAVNLLAHITGISVNASEDFLVSIKRPLIPDTRYTPLYLVSSLESIPQNQLFQSAVELMQVLSKESTETESTETVEDEISEKLAEDTELEELVADTEAWLTKMLSIPKERIEEARISTEAWLAKDMARSVKSHSYLSFSQYVRSFDRYPDRKTLLLMVDLWERIPTLTGTVIDYKDYLIYCWVDIDLRELQRQMYTLDMVPGYLAAAIYAYIENLRLESISFKDLLNGFCEGRYREDRVYEELLRRVISFGVAQGIYKADPDLTIHDLTENSTLVDKLFRGKPMELLPLPGRNDNCACGSGKKYKKCCIKYLEGNVF